jgi:hypothetical protein
MGSIVVAQTRIRSYFRRIEILTDRNASSSRSSQAIRRRKGARGLECGWRNLAAEIVLPAFRSGHPVLAGAIGTMALAVRTIRLACSFELGPVDIQMTERAEG